MPVQAAVLEPACAGRDLLVSSQTGSGKTIAFGAVLSQTLLGDSDAKFTRKPRPSALVIVPTRELAVQVREELGWMFKHTGMHLASFTGGTAVSGDLQALRRGVDVAIGTPGRLVDLVRRERLDLADVAVLVLDEADEMLDLGFREDLETLLKAAPATRRTVMLSATLPREIREMARQFQRDALPVDPRTNGTAGGPPQKQAHDDITYVAHLIAAGDRLPAVVNLLRASNAERAIVFCTTREAVGVLHEALLKRGITASAISGDRAQAERDRALDLVRRGEARVLVATNVAARGLHLPDVDLIIHADLPLNAESLTHRSGRTGRAGRKGTAVLLATATERRKAERLLGMANVRANWTPPPSAEAITQAACDRLLEDLSAEADGSMPAAKLERIEEALARLNGKVADELLLRRLMLRELDRLPAGEVLRAPSSASAFARDGGSSRDDADRGSRPPRGGREGVMFRVNLGVRDKAEARWLLPLICRRGGITNREVGAIRVGPSETVFEIAPSAAADFAAAAAQPDPREPHIRVERADARGAGPGRPAHAAGPPSRGPRPPHARPTASASPRPAAPARMTPPAERPSAPADLDAGSDAKATETKAPAPKAAHAKPIESKVAHVKAVPATPPSFGKDRGHAPLPRRIPPAQPVEAEAPKEHPTKPFQAKAPRAVTTEAAATPAIKAPHPKAPRAVETEQVVARPIKAPHPRAPRAVETERIAARPIKAAAPKGPRNDGGNTPFARPAHAAPGARSSAGGNSPFARPARPAHAAPVARSSEGGNSPFRRPDQAHPRSTSGGNSPFARPSAPLRKAPFERPTGPAKSHARPDKPSSGFGPRRERK